MTEITEKQLIYKLHTLKEIKPRKEWASLLKSQILAEKKEVVLHQAGFTDFISAVLRFGSGQIFSRKFAYSFAAVLILIAGAFGLARLLPSGTAPQNSTASLTQQTRTQSEAEKKVVANLSEKIKDLKQALIVNPKQDSQTVKGIADSLKTLADLSGNDLDQDVEDLYRTLVWSQIYDLQHSTLTDKGIKVLSKIEGLTDQEKYTEALEEILLINKSDTYIN